VFYKRTFNCCCKNKETAVHDQKLEEIYLKAEATIEKEMDMDTILKSLRASQIYLNDIGLENAEMKF
jgi:hypothetical protein